MVPGSTVTTLPSVIIAASVGMAGEWVGIGLRFVSQIKQGSAAYRKTSGRPAIPTDFRFARRSPCPRSQGVVSLIINIMGDYKGRRNLRQRKKRFAKEQRIRALSATEKRTTPLPTPGLSGN